MRIFRKSKRAWPEHACERHSGCNGKVKTNSGEEIDCEHIVWICSKCNELFDDKSSVLMHIMDRADHELVYQEQE